MFYGGERAERHFGDLTHPIAWLPPPLQCADLLSTYRRDSGAVNDVLAYSRFLPSTFDSPGLCHGEPAARSLVAFTVSPGSTRGAAVFEARR